MRIVYGDDGSETCVFEKGEKEEIRMYVMEILDFDMSSIESERDIDEMTENVINRMMETGEGREEALAYCRAFC